MDQPEGPRPSATLLLSNCEGTVMNRRTFLVALPLLLAAALLTAFTEVRGQPDRKKGFGKKKDFEKKDFFQNGPGGFGGPGGQVRKLVKQFDKDGDGRLNKEERKAARASLQKERAKGGKGFGPGGFAGPGGMFAKQLLSALDDDEDGKLTKAELAAGVKKFFAGADKSKKDSLTEAQLTTA